MVAVSISPRTAEHFLTLVWPLPTLAVAAHKLATTEQSDTASCTRSTLCSGTVITGFNGGWSPVCNDGGGRASFARFQPSRYFIWWGVSKSSWLSLQGKVSLLFEPSWYICRMLTYTRHYFQSVRILVAQEGLSKVETHSRWSSKLYKLKFLPWLAKLD